MYENLEGVLLRYEDISRELASPGIAQDMDRYRKLTREQADLSPLVSTYQDYKKALADLQDAKDLLSGETDEEMRELAKEEMSAAKEKSDELAGKIRILLIPKDPDDDRSVILEIRAGAGGDEAALFAAEVFRMYTHYAEKKGWKTSVIDSESIGIGGLKFVSFMVEGPGAYGCLKYESGVHRVQRVPETESQGRIHTSTITVAAMPEVEDDIEINIPPEDIRFVFDRFYKTDKSRSIDKKGMGLGLFIAKTIMRLHGGDIYVDSRVNEYTTFTIRLPKTVQQSTDTQTKKNQKFVETTVDNETEE